MKLASGVVSLSSEQDNLSTVLSSQRLILRTPRPSDLDALAAIMGDPEVMRYIGDGSVMDSAGVAERIARFISYQEQYGHTMWAVEHRETSELIGECGLVPIRRSGHSGNCRLSHVVPRGGIIAR